MKRYLSVALFAAASVHAAPPDDARLLQRDELVTSLQLPATAHRLFAIDVPADVRQFDVNLVGDSPLGSGPASGLGVLSVNASSAPGPGASCRMFAVDMQATCTVPNHGATRHYIRVDARTAVRDGTLVVKWRDDTQFDEDRYESWYRSITPATWIAQGADANTIASVLDRIKRAPGPRRDPEAPDTRISEGPGHWVREWRVAGDAALGNARLARQRGDRKAAKNAYLEAIHYYNIASYPHLNEDAPGIAALEASQSAYVEAAPLMTGTFSAVDMEYQGIPFRGYLHVPEGQGPFPVLIKSAGSDIVNEIFYASWERELAPRNIAVLLIDLPGIGGSRRHVLTPDSDKLHAAALRYLYANGKRLDARLDTKQIAVEGASFGGNAAGRFSLRRDLRATAVVSVCGPQDAIFRKPAAVYAKMPRMTTDAVRSRMGVAPDAPWEVFAQNMRRFSLGPAGQGLLPVSQTHPGPLLAIGTLQDPVAPLEDLVLLTDAAQKAELRIFDVAGHCPPRPARDAIIGDWLQARFRPN